MEAADQSEEINSCSFNQDNGCFIVSTTAGIRVFNTHEFQSTFFRDFEGGIKLAEMLFRTNIIGFVGTGKNSNYPLNRLILWDDIQHRPFGELNFKSDVLNVKLRKDRVVVVLESKIYVYNFQNLDCSDSFMTIENKSGLVSLSTAEDVCVLAIPDENVGMVKVIDFTEEPKKIVTLKCHDTSIAAITLSQDGSILATASQKGTLIRLFDTKEEKQLAELRRGADPANITDISIDPLKQYVSCASDKGTIHVFHTDVSQNKKSSLGSISGMLSYFGSKWSFTQFRVKDQNCKCAIINAKIFAISTQGNYFMGDIVKSGDIKIEKQADLLEEQNRVEAQQNPAGEQ